MPIDSMPILKPYGNCFKKHNIVMCSPFICPTIFLYFVFYNYPQSARTKRNMTNNVLFSNNLRHTIYISILTIFYIYPCSSNQISIFDRLICSVCKVGIWVRVQQVVAHARTLRMSDWVRVFLAIFRTVCTRMRANIKIKPKQTWHDCRRGIM